jgi:hypothetical protein
MNDQELDREVSRALHELFPEPTRVGLYVPDASPRPRHRTVAIFGAAAAVLAVGLAVGLLEATSHGNGPATGPQAGASASTGAAPSTATTSASTGIAPPAWALDCLPKKASDDLGPASIYLGLTKAEADRLADQRGDQLVFAGGGGQCSTFSDDVYRTNPVAVVYDVSPTKPSGSNGPLPPTARIVAAEKVAPGWAPGT